MFTSIMFYPDNFINNFIFHNFLDFWTDSAQIKDKKFNYAWFLELFEWLYLNMLSRNCKFIYQPIIETKWLLKEECLTAYLTRISRNQF